ncbi:HNH endonuclease [Streptomyces sp. CA-106110]|uniref:HNH endonuclease n=1 Tax=Streptomyces sp. CA-106110 TaxID=3240044 RepID=UPI003D905997
MPSMLADQATRQRYNKSLRLKGVPAKACSRCHTVRSLGQFSGAEHRCKPCCAARQATRRKDPAVRASEATHKAEYRAANRDRIAEYGAAYRAENRDRIAKRQAEYRAANRDRIAERQAEYRAANRDRIAEYGAAYHAENRDRIAEYQRRRRSDPATRDHVLARKRANEQRRTALKYGAEADGHSADDMLAYWDAEDLYACVYCGGPYEAIEHSVPLRRDGAHVLENLVPACTACNAAKGDRCPYEFLAERFPGLAPLLAPLIESSPRLSDEEMERRLAAYRAR